MPGAIKVEATLDIPDGVYHLKIAQIEQFEGKFKPAIKIYFMVDPASGYEGIVTGLFPIRATARNKTGKLLMAALGECTVGTEYNWDMLLNRKIYGLIENQDTDEGLFARVKKAIFPPPNAAAVTPPPAPRSAFDTPDPPQPGAETKDDNMPF